MTTDQVTYLVFGLALFIAVFLDLGLLSKRSAEISFKKAFIQTILWISLACIFFGFLWFYEGNETALQYFSAYLMEWSLSIDNIFVFILIFSFFRIRNDHIARALLIGILMAIIFRIIFITVGLVLVSQFDWILYVFGAIILFTGIKIFFTKQEEEYDPSKNKVYRLITKVLPIVHEDISGKLTVKKDGKRFYTNLFVVVVLLATTDIVFALDSIPAVFAISQDKLVIYTSNIFAVLGLRSLFFLLKGAVAKFDYLQQGIAVVLVFIGVKMLIDFFGIHLSTWVSLIVIVLCLSASIGYSIRNEKYKLKS